MNEIVEMITVCSSPSEIPWVAAKIASTVATCPQNDIMTTLVDATPDGSLLNDLSVFSSSELEVIAHPTSSGFCDSFAFAANRAHSMRPESGFICCSHPDVVAVKVGWLDIALEILLDPSMPMVGFEPFEKFVSSSGDQFAVPYDWCTVMRSDSWTTLGGFPPALTGFTGIPWLAIELSLLGRMPRGIRSPHPMVCHAARSASMGKGRRRAQGAAEEMQALNEAISSGKAVR